MIKNCLYCNKEFTKRPKASKEQWRKKKFCSHRCYSKNIIKTGCNARENNPHWKSGGFITCANYKMILNPSHPRAHKNGYVPEHIIVAEKVLSRPLNDFEIIHHINGNKIDNSPENLYLFDSDFAHRSYHANVRWNNINYSLISNLSFVGD